MASAGVGSVAAIRRTRPHLPAGYGFILPALLVLAAVVVGPLVTAVAESFSVSARRGGAAAPGLDNYGRLFADGAFATALANTVTFTVGSVLPHFALGLAAALLLNVELKGRVLFRVIALIPWTIAPVVVGVLWRWMYNAQFGVVNDVLLRLGAIDTERAWLGEAALAMPAVVLANIWRGFPFAMLICLAGLQAVPPEQLEAASVDGAGALRRFWHITLPNIRYIVVVGLILDAIWTFKQFDLVQVMTGGGPADSTEVLATLVFRTAFEYLEFPYASTMAVAMFALLGVLTAVYLRLVMRGAAE